MFLCLAAPAAAQTVPTRASLDSCRAGSAPLQRFAVFSAQMGTVPGTSRMQVRFDLLSQVPGRGRPYKRVSAPGLGVWRSSSPGVDIFRYRKQVANLAAPGRYRMLVRFRWVNEAGKTIQSATRRTAVCKQPDLRSDLSIGDVFVQRGDQPGRARYLIEVRNEGRAATPSFGVGLTVGDQVQPAQTVQTLAPGDARELVFAGPRCARGSTLRVTLDPDLAVEESDESNNARTLPCPL